MAQQLRTKPQSSSSDLICFSHLRWRFVFQRPQHLMIRFARERRVFFYEEPIFDDGPSRLVVERTAEGVLVVTPHLKAPADPAIPHTELSLALTQRRLLDQLVAEHRIGPAVLWYYTPMALPFSGHLASRAIVYDCMDELTGFMNAPPSLAAQERELFRRATVVFTGGVSLYESKRRHHSRVYPFPSSVDVPHFARARLPCVEPADQAPVPRPRLGFFGVIDERLELSLLDALCRARPDWHFVLIGPVVKIAPQALPRHANLHHLGQKRYEELPEYVAGWDVALMPFARNDATRYISPTKTPEYLAAGRPVVSTSIRDVVSPYGERGLVEVADTVDGFLAAIDRAMTLERAQWLKRVNDFLGGMSWERTFQSMRALVEGGGATHARPEMMAGAS